MTSMSGMAMPSATSTMAMSGMSMSATGAAAAASTSSAMSMSMGGGSSCKISMLWNWNTIDTCFLSSSWHVTSKGMFAGSCIGVVFLVVALELLRRAGKEYDRYLIRSYQQKLAASIVTRSSSTDPGKGSTDSIIVRSQCAPGTFRPNVFQQAVRALLHMLAFAVAYFVMLLAMYYNGYMIICIFIGAYIGFFIFGWESVSVVGPNEETTVCCG